MWPAALHLFDSMKLCGVTFNASHEGIVKVLGLNWAMALQVTMHVPDCLADAALYRQALLSCLRSGELMQALRPRRPRGFDHMVLASFGMFWHSVHLRTGYALLCFVDQLLLL